ncbi:major capsid protein [uncultured Bacteroides sp.]|uniref:major capsid protein n=1 Tax=uncultured Bacteroides sp. TaxID=162156 RepID=UPI0026112922|nr:major capsid protein [uncultured Bacteroides sp.]
MNESLFAKYIAKFFPKLQRLIEKVNGKRNKNLTYLHKGENAMLRQEYSPDNKWESTSVNTTYVAADFVAVDSELPVKSRDSIASANGKLPKIGMSKILKESDINNINVMEAQGGNAQKIVKKLSDDAVACSVGIDERNEYNFLFALSNGYVAIKDEDTPNALLRLNFNYLAANTFGATTKGLPSLEDIKRVISKADGDGNSVIQICIAKSTYDKLRQTKEAKELVANYNGQSFTKDTILPTPTATKFNEAFADDNNGISFKVIDRSVIFEKDGKKISMKPWNANRLVFICNDVVGTLVYGRLAEKTNPVKNVDYQEVDAFKLISKYSLTNPLREITAGQAFVAPIIEDVDQIYVLDISEAQEVDTEAEASDVSDEKITIWGKAYTKTNFVAELNKIAGSNFDAKTSDEALIEAVNKLSDAKENKLKAAVESYVSE